VDVRGISGVELLQPVVQESLGCSEPAERRHGDVHRDGDGDGGLGEDPNTASVTAPAARTIGRE